MKIYTNETMISTYQKRAMRFSMAGLLGMAVALALLWMPQYAAWAWPALIIGVGVSLAGTYYANRWIRPPLPEKLLEEECDDLSSRYVLFNHTGPVPHLMLTPRGLIPIRAKRYEGPVRYNATSKEWKGQFSFRRFYGTGLTAEGVGDPPAEVAAEEEAVRAWLGEQLPEHADNVPVQGLALFLPEKTTLEVAEPPVPLAQKESVCEMVQQLFGRGKPLPRATYNALLQVLESNLPDELRETAE